MKEKKVPSDFRNLCISQRLALYNTYRFSLHGKQFWLYLLNLSFCLFYLSFQNPMQSMCYTRTSSQTTMLVKDESTVELEQTYWKNHEFSLILKIWFSNNFIKSWIMKKFQKAFFGKLSSQLQGNNHSYKEFQYLLSSCFLLQTERFIFSFTKFLQRGTR